MSNYYQREVSGVIDYALSDTPYGFQVRGPYRSDDAWIEESISFIGAAQTFGHFANTPFPKLVTEVFSLNALNAGVSGAGPELFSKNKRLIEDINKSKLCVIQVMSGRSSSNRYFKNIDGTSMGHLNLNNISRDKIQGHDAFSIMLKELPQPELIEVINETLKNYQIAYRELCEQITVKKILLWISARPPHYDRGYRFAAELLSEFPHLIDDATFNAISAYCDEKVLVHSNFGLGRRLWDSRMGQPYVVDRKWGRIDTHSHMYSDPYLHLQAASALVEKIQYLDLM